MSKSPFARFANSVLRFVVPGVGPLVPDINGNLRPAPGLLTVSAMLDMAEDKGQSGLRELREADLPGVDETSIYLEGYAVEPMVLPGVVGYKSIASEANWDGRAGRFILGMVTNSPYGDTKVTGQEIKGYFMASSFPASGTPYSPPIPDSGVILIPFAYGDATPRSIATVDAGVVVTTVQIIIVTPFNGVGAALQLGDAGQADRLMSSSEVDPTFAAEYEANPNYTYSSSTPILLTITPGAGATTGAGFVLVEARTI